MNLQDGLDELRSALLRDQSALKSGPTDHFWEDASLIRYIDEAQVRFAKRSLCIHDATNPECTQITLKGDGKTDVYLLHPSVISVLSARHQDDIVDLSRVRHDILMTQNIYSETFDFASFPPAGKPTQYSTDESLEPEQDYAVRLRVYGMPDDTATPLVQTGKRVFMRVIRKPMVELTLDTLDQDFEIPSDYQLDMLEWAAWRALRNLDIDGEDRKKASEHKTRFEEAVKEARNETLRKLWQPLQWGFGGNGFTYVHN